MPNTYGVPVALCGVPSTELAAAAVALPAALADAVLDALLDAGALELPELLQPAAVSAKGSAKTECSHLIISSVTRRLRRTGTR